VCAESHGGGCHPVGPELRPLESSELIRQEAFPENFWKPATGFPSREVIGALKNRIEVALDMISKAPEHSMDQAMADEINKTEFAAWQAFEAHKEVLGRESARIIEEYRAERVRLLDQLLSIGPVDPNEWGTLQEEFRAAHEQNPELYVWRHINESPLPIGDGSLHFRELANRAAWAFSRDGDQAWKFWLDVLVGYLLVNDPDEEYLHRMQVGPLVRPEGTTYETHPGVRIYGETYRIDHLSKASELCCAWLKLSGCRQQPAFGRRQIKLVAMRSAGNRTAAVHANAELENPLVAAMRRQGLNCPRLAAQVQTVLKRRGVTRIKADRTTIYRLVSGQTRHPDPTIRSAVLEVLKLSAD